MFFEKKNKKTGNQTYFPLENIKQFKKIVNKQALIFSCLVSKFLKVLCIFEFHNPYIIQNQK